ncbi:T9SS type A sorting domain-containing protein [Maribellus sediminis]|uniref:T9SS type A sorting domain-containing protein n=1 Tax=Maribellus sediminis TaxID=2696285 RepID=UPI00142FF37C|nr:T9SS type A sorting domain-containing protein [Maribellus sediminis]
MKRLYILTLLIWPLGALLAQNHFQPAFEGNGYDHMNIYIVESIIEGMDMQAGDEIAVFDGDVCAGVFVLTEPLANGTIGFINASRADLDTSGAYLGNGYMPDNAISFKLWDESTATEYDNVDLTFIDPDTDLEVAAMPFTVGGTAFVRLSQKSSIDLGNTTIYSSSSTATGRVSIPVTFTEDGKIGSVSIYHEGGTGNVLLGIYSDASGSPGSRLGVTASTAVSGTAGWQTVSLLDSVPVASGTTVWLAYIFEESVKIHYALGTPGRAYSSDTWSSGMPLDYGTSSKANVNISVYCSYVAGAIEPPVPTGTDLGNTTIYSSSSTATGRVSIPVTFTEDGKIGSVSIYHEGGTGNVLLGIYSDASGSPGSRLGVTASTAVSGTAGWQTVSLLDSVPVASGTTVWLAYIFEESVKIHYALGTPGRAYSSDTWSSGMPLDYGTSSKANVNISVYCSYTVNTVLKAAESKNPNISKTTLKDTKNLASNRSLDFKVYPNPFSSNLIIDFVKEEGESLSLVIYDIQGRIINRMDGEIVEGSNTLSWDATDATGNKVHPGMYLLLLQSDLRKETFKVVYQGN